MKYLLLISIFSFLIPTISLPVQNFNIEFEIKSKFTKKEKQFASVIAIEAKKKTFTDAKGKAILQLPKGKQTILIRLVGHKEQKITIDITSDTQRTIFLLPTKILSQYIEITDRISKQIAGHQSLSQEEIKSTPGALSDALRAITVLPNVFLSNGVLGSIILRGAIEDANLYTIDGIPVLYPRHYGGIALIIPVNFIKKIHVYASAPPIDFGQVYGGVVDIETQDNVEEKKLSIETSFIQSSLYFQIPINDFGYSISSARIGYLDYTLRPIVRIIFPATQKIRINFPLYIDYQQKLVFFLTKDHKHTINFLSLGSIDRYKKESHLIDNSARGQSLQSVSDSFANSVQIDRDSQIYINNLNYTFKPSRKIKNQISTYHSYSYVNTYKYIPKIFIPKENLPIDDDIDIKESTLVNTLETNVFSVKDTFKWNYLDLGYSNSTLTLGIQYKYFHYKTFGETEFFATPNFSDQSLVNYLIENLLNGLIEKLSDVFRIEDSTFKMEHHYLEGYFKNKFYFSDFILETGARLSYLQFTQNIAPSGWVNIEYTVPIIQLQLFASSGYYSSFVQTNLYKINKPITQQTLFTTTSSKPENAIHVTGGLQQTIFRLYQLKIEGFHTYMRDVGYLKYDLTEKKYTTPPSLLKHSGFEATFTKKLSQAKHTFSFLINYSLTFSSYKNNFTKNEFVPFPFEQRHAIKTNLNYSVLGHTIGLRFELYSGFPYTPFTEADRAPLRNDIYTPSSLKTKINSSNYPLRHRMDIRYTYTRYHKHLKWSIYGEIINLYNYRAKQVQEFNYFAPFSKGNPKIADNPRLAFSPSDFPLIFNFAFELTI